MSSGMFTAEIQELVAIYLPTTPLIVDNQTERVDLCIVVRHGYEPSNATEKHG